MGQHVFDGSETGPQSLTHFNTMLGELYAGGGIPLVNTFADLPTASSYTDKIYRVKTTTGSWLTFNKKSSGIYQSNGTTWILQPGVMALADLIDVAISSEPTGGKSLTYNTSTDVWEASGPFAAVAGGVINGQKDTRTDLPPADGATATLDCDAGNAFKIIAPDTGAGMDFTIALSHVPSGSVFHSIEVAIVVGTNIPTISYTNKGANVTAPTLVASRTNIIVISTWDNGTTLMINSAGNY
jgi:hypothetical protein